MLGVEGFLLPHLSPIDGLKQLADAFKHVFHYCFVFHRNFEINLADLVILSRKGLNQGPGLPRVCKRSSSDSCLEDKPPGIFMVFPGGVHSFLKTQLWH